MVVYAHICRGIYYGSYMEPRQFLWCSGVILLFLMMGTAFTCAVALIILFITRQSYTHFYSTSCMSTPRIIITVMCCGKTLSNSRVRLNILSQESPMRY